jgi:dTMP kinase
MKPKNLFIAFEGIDGSGKSTQLKLLSEYLSNNGHKVYTTFEPTDSFIGSMIRKIFRHEVESDHRTIAALFAADRLDHILNKENGLLKKLEEGFTVLSDRYYFSSYAYHSVHMPMNWVIETNSLSAELLRPDLNIFIDVEPKTSMNRINENRESMELYETEDNLNKVRSLYFEAFDRMKDFENIVRVNGERSSEQVAQEIAEIVTNYSRL